MKTKRNTALVIAVILCLQSALIYWNPINAKGSDAVDVQILSNPTEAVSSGTIEVIGAVDATGAISLRLSTALNINYLEEKINTYTKDIIDITDTEGDNDTSDETPEDPESGAPDENSQPPNDDETDESNNTDEPDTDGINTDGEIPEEPNPESGNEDEDDLPGQDSNVKTLTGREAFDSLGDELEIRKEINSLVELFQPITYSITLDGEVFKTDSYPEDSVEIYNNYGLAGSYEISVGEEGNPVLTVTLDNYVYYTAVLEIEHTINMYLKDDTKTDIVPTGVLLDNGVFSLAFDVDSTNVNQPAANALRSTYDEAGTIAGNLASVVNFPIGAIPPFTIYPGEGVEETGKIYFNKQIYSFLNLDVNAPEQDGTNYKMGFTIECEFNTDFLEQCFLATGGYNTDPNFSWPPLTFDFEFNTRDVNNTVEAEQSKQYFTFTKGTLTYIVSNNSASEGVNIGEIKVTDDNDDGVYKFEIKFYPYEIYNAGQAKGTAVFSAALEGQDRAKWEPTIETTEDGKQIAIEWENPNVTEPIVIPPVAVTKRSTNIGTVSDPYIEYELVFTANTPESDLRELVIVDDLKRQANYGLNAIGFTYEITLADETPDDMTDNKKYSNTTSTLAKIESSKYGNGMFSDSDKIIGLPLSSTDSTSAGQSFVYLKNSPDPITISTNEGDTASGFLASAYLANPTPITLSSLYNDSSNGEMFIMDVGEFMKVLEPSPTGTPSAVTEVKIKLYTMIDADAYELFMNAARGNSQDSGSYNFKNRAFGFYGAKSGTNKTRVQSAETETPVEFKYFFKNADPFDFNKKIHYTITAATYFMNGMGDAYIVDRIDRDRHTLDTNSVKFNDVALGYEVPNVTEDISDGDDAGLRISYTDTTIENLNLIWKALGKKTGDDTPPGGNVNTEAVYYIFGDEQITIYRLGSNYLNKPVKIEYDTSIVIENYDHNDVVNDARILVKNNYLGGVGPGGTILKDPIGTLNKSTEVIYKIANKVPDNTSFSSEDVTWTITFNTTGENMTEVTVIDKIDLSKMVLLELGGVNKDACIKTGGTISLSNGVVLNYITPGEFANKFLENPTLRLTSAPITENYYTYDDTTQEGYGLIKFYFYEMPSGETPTLKITTRVVDASILAGNAASNKVFNTLDAWWWNATTKHPQEPMTVSTEINIPKISKAKGDANSKNTAYNYSNGSMLWTIKANTGNQQIQKMVVNDFLPPESYLSAVKEIRYNGNTYAVPEETATFIEKTDSQQTAVLAPAWTWDGISSYLKVVVEPSQLYSDSTTGFNIVRFYACDSNGTKNDTVILDKQLTIVIETKFKESYKAKLAASNSVTYHNYTTLDGIVGRYNEPRKEYEYVAAGTIDATALSENGDDSLAVTKNYWNHSKKIARDEAPNSLSSFQLATKSAQLFRDGQTYNSEVYRGLDKVHWTLVINRDLYKSIAGATVTDVINSGNDIDPVTKQPEEWFRLATETMKVSTGTLSSTGTVSIEADDTLIYDKNTPDPLASTLFPELDDMKFKFVVPVIAANKVVVIEFDTYIITTKTLKNSNIKNKATITYSGNAKTINVDSTSLASPTNTAHSYASINYLPNIYVVKSNKGTDINGDTLTPYLKYDGIKFKLVGYSYSIDAQGKMQINYNDIKYPEKYATTKVQGSVQEQGSSQIPATTRAAVFPVLDRKNIIYILTEIDVGDFTNSLIMDAQPRYIIVDASATPNANKLENLEVNANIQTQDGEKTEKIVVETITTNVHAVYYSIVSDTVALSSAGVNRYGYVVRTTTDNKYYATFVMFNSRRVGETPKGGSIIGEKVGYNPLRLQDKEYPLAGAVFSLFTSREDAENPNINGFTEKDSGADGKFEFTGLAPGIYYLRELYAPDSIYVPSSRIIEINVTGKDSNKDIDGIERVTKDTSGNLIKIVNDEIVVTGEIVGYKVDDNGAMLTGAVFGLYTDASGSVAIATTTSRRIGNRAEFRFTLPPVEVAKCPITYYVKEISAPAGYEKSNKTYEVTLTGVHANEPTSPKNITEIISTDVNGARLEFVNNLIPGEPPSTPPYEPDDDDSDDTTGTETPPPVTPRREIIPEPEITPPPVVPETTPPTESVPPETTPPTENVPPVPEPYVEEIEPPVPTPPEPPNLPDVDPEDIYYPEQLPNGYSAVSVGEDTYVIYDGDGVPLGYVIVPPGMTLDNINIMDELIPLTTYIPQAMKKNPVTGGSTVLSLIVFIAIVFIFSIKRFILTRRI